MAINTLLAYVTIQLCGALLASATMAITDHDYASSPSQVLRFLLIVSVASIAITAIPTAIYSTILGALFSFAPRRYIHARFTVPVSIAMTLVAFIACIELLDSPIAELWPFLLESLFAGLAGTLVLIKHNGQQSGPASPHNVSGPPTLDVGTNRK